MFPDKKRFLAHLITLISVLFPIAAPVMASMVTFKPDGSANNKSITALLQTKQVGTVNFAKSIVAIKDARIEIAPDPYLYQDNPSALAGFIVKSEAIVSGPMANISGIAYFNGGYNLSELDKNNGDDSVFRKQGAINGRIMGLDGGFLIVADKTGTVSKVPLSDILYIRSPRAFTFVIHSFMTDTQPLAPTIQATADEVSFKGTAFTRQLPLNSVVPNRKVSEDDELDRLLKKYGVDDDGGEKDSWP